jgi:hypothetical protein
MKLLRFSKIKILLCLFWLILFSAGLIGYAGSKNLYVGFSLVFLALLLSSFYRNLSYGYLFLTIFLWLGFWFKLNANFLIFGHFPFGEPVGMFDSSPAAWDSALWVAMAAASGVMIGRFIYGLFKPVSTCTLNEVGTPPVWYAAYRISLWIIVVSTCLALAAVNSIYGIHQIGLSPKTILPWPMNALIAWVVSIGGAMAMTTLLSWEFRLGKNLTTPMYLVLFEALVSTISLLSRATYLFHVIPPAITLSLNKKISWYSNKKARLQFLTLFVVMFAISLITVSKLRDHYYTTQSTSVSKSVTDITTSAVPTVAAAELETPSLRLTLLHQLFVNRWIGLEGVMAVLAYPNKSMQLLLEMARERRVVGEPTRYQAISNSSYQAANSQYQFASLPGVAAFLFYSGSFLVLIAGMVIFTLSLLVLERLIFALTQNPFLCSLLGLTFANLIAQFGITPRQDIPFIMMIIGAVVGIAILQSKFVAQILARLALVKSV